MAPQACCLEAACRTPVWCVSSKRLPQVLWSLIAGHAGDVIGDSWYIVGGGNNTSGCTDMVALDLTPLGSSDDTSLPLTWSVVSQAEPRSAIVSEGLTVEAVPYARCLLSFGGYNGKYQSALQIFKPGKQNTCHMSLLSIRYIPADRAEC